MNFSSKSTSDLFVEMNHDDNVIYTLNNNDVFSQIEYKVMKKSSYDIFVNCTKSLYNGKIELFYLSKSYKAFSDLIGILDINSIILLIKNLFECVNTIKNNGFLSCLNLETTMEHIYVEFEKFQVKLVYLPLNPKIYSNMSSFEEHLRANLVDFLKKSPSSSSPSISNLITLLLNKSLSIEEILNNVNEKMYKSNDNETHDNKIQMKLKSIDSSVELEIAVNKDEFVLGREKDAVDGFVSYNRMIGRKHCKIIYQNDKYYIVDLDSLNGTFLNGVRLEANKMIPVKNGDLIRLSHSKFKVVIN